eukprot:TRINITY_DN8422_c0_g1_i3.p3 TRINITY_DN8422_c0_g1~~TRINITY_DN8422_c0_g1_i3.p3  ORF type:complete len:107 (-),score=18.84 TRINITY_DN8422_c0_g1_i3:99-419(-)
MPPGTLRASTQGTTGGGTSAAFRSLSRTHGAASLPKTLTSRGSETSDAGRGLPDACNSFNSALELLRREGDEVALFRLDASSPSPRSHEFLEQALLLVASLSALPN